MKEVIRVGVVDDHEMLLVGFAGAAHLDATALEAAKAAAVQPADKAADVPVRVVRTGTTVEKLLAGGEKIFDVVALDMSLGDGTRPGDNVRRIRDAGYPVLIFSEANNPADLREALAAGASGVSRKTDSYETTLRKLRIVADGEIIDDQQLAAAIDGDTELVTAAKLSPQERETLRWYATGRTRTQVAEKMNVKETVVATYIKRARAKYEAVGRAAKNKDQLRKRGLEDGFVDPD